MTVLVTGASGHIGAHVVRHLIAQGRAVRAFVRPTSNLKGLEGLDVEIARGHLLAEERGKIGERYILGGENLTILGMFRMLGELTGRRSPRIEVGRRMLSALGWGAELWGHLRGKPPLITRARARSIVGRYAFYDSSKAQRELGYTARSARIALGEAVRWVQEQAWG